MAYEYIYRKTTVLFNVQKECLDACTFIVYNVQRTYIQIHNVI